MSARLHSCILAILGTACLSYLFWFCVRPHGVAVPLAGDANGTAASKPSDPARLPQSDAGGDMERPWFKGVPSVSELRKILESSLNPRYFSDYSVASAGSAHRSAKRLVHSETRLLDVSVKRAPELAIRVVWINGSWTQLVSSDRHGASLMKRAEDDIRGMLFALSMSRVHYDRIRFVGRYARWTDSPSSLPNIDVIFAYSTLQEKLGRRGGMLLPGDQVLQLAESIRADRA